MEIEKCLAEYLIETQFEEIPKSAIEATKSQIINILSAIIGGSSADGISPLMQLLKDWGGKPESTVIQYGVKLPASRAAQANASMGHALDFDDTYNKMTLHVAVVTVPPALAIAEKIGGVSGKEFLTSIALAVDLGCRMTNVLQAPPGKAQTSWHFWHFTTLFGHFMAATAAGRLLKLNTRQMLDALGLAYHQASGNMQVIREGALAKRLGPGFASRAGVEAALMAQADISGAKDFIEGEVNFYKLYHSTCEYIDLSQLTAGLGTKFENANVSLKPYPCGVVNHTAIEAALALAVENDIRPAEVVKITVHTGAGSHVLCRPIDVKRHPKNAVDTQFSIPWSVATAIAKRKAAIEDYTAEATGDNVVNDLTDKLEAQIEPSFSGGTIEPARVTVILNNGKQLMKQVDHPSGSPEKPFSPDEVRRKFENCNSVSRKPLTTREIEKLTAMVARLEDVADISDLTEMLN